MHSSYLFLDALLAAVPNTSPTATYFGGFAKVVFWAFLGMVVLCMIFRATTKRDE